MWQPGILKKLREIECTTNIISVVKDYFTNRKVCASSEFGTVTREIDSGCPQGSILTPHLWNLVFEESNNVDREEINYTDDKVIIIQGNSRKHLETKANLEMARIECLCKKNKLKLSAEKSELTTIKRKL